MKRVAPFFAACPSGMPEQIALSVAAHILISEISRANINSEAHATMLSLLRRRTDPAARFVLHEAERIALLLGGVDA